MSTTDPDATHLRQRDGVRLGYQAHYVVDGGKARIILAALVAPAEVPEDHPAWHGPVLLSRVSVLTTIYSTAGAGPFLSPILELEFGHFGWQAG